MCHFHLFAKEEKRANFQIYLSQRHLLLGLVEEYRRRRHCWSFSKPVQLNVLVGRTPVKGQTASIPITHGAFVFVHATAGKGATAGKWASAMVLAYPDAVGVERAPVGNGF